MAAALSWPGNVRELSHLMERVTLLHPEVILDAWSTLERLCLAQPQPLHRRQAAAQADRELQDEPARIRQALIQSGGNVVRAARLLGISRDAVRYRMRHYGIQRPLSELSSPWRESQAEGQRHGSPSPRTLPSQFEGNGPG